MYLDRNRVINALSRDYPQSFFLESAVLHLESILDIKGFLEEYLFYLERINGKKTALHHMKLVLLNTLASHCSDLGRERYMEWIACWKLFTYRHNFLAQAFSNA